MIKAGVIDPVKVVRGALDNAASIAAMILTTDVLITDMPEKDKLLPCLLRHGRNGLLTRPTPSPLPVRGF
jgi:chaperonin GroEL